MKHREEPVVYTPQTALKALMEGNARFVNGAWPAAALLLSFEALAQPPASSCWAGAKVSSMQSVRSRIN
jgi:hypothetical protein